MAVGQILSTGTKLARTPAELAFPTSKTMSPYLYQLLDLYSSGQKLPAGGMNVVKQYLKAKENPAVYARETQKRASGTDINLQALPEKNIIRPSDLQGEVLVPTFGDRSLTGGVLHSVEGVPLNQGVLVQGGPGYIRQNSDRGVAFASMENQAQKLQNRINKAAKDAQQDPIGAYGAMHQTDGLKFTTAAVEAMLRQFDALDIPKSALREAEEEIRQKKPNFVGFDSDDLYNQVLGENGFPKKGAGALRIDIIDVLRQPKFRDQGFPVYEDVAKAITEPQLVSANVGDSGFEFYRGKAGADLVDSQGHMSYDKGVQGTSVGGFPISVPVQDMYPDLYREGLQKVNKNGRPFTHSEILGDIKLGTGFQPVTQEVVDRSSAALERLGYKGLATAGLSAAAGSLYSDRSAAGALDDPKEDRSSVSKFWETFSNSLNDVTGNSLRAQAQLAIAPFAAVPSPIQPVAIAAEGALAIPDVVDAVQALGDMDPSQASQALKGRTGGQMRRFSGNN